VSNTQCHNWPRSLFLYVKMVKYHILGQRQCTGFILAWRKAQQGMLQMWRYQWWLTSLIFITWHRVCVTWIRRSWYLKPNDTYPFLHCHHHLQILRQIEKEEQIIAIINRKLVYNLQAHLQFDVVPWLSPKRLKLKWKKSVKR
jgi:hypothetical protein